MCVVNIRLKCRGLRRVRNTALSLHYLRLVLTSVNARQGKVNPFFECLYCSAILQALTFDLVIVCELWLLRSWVANLTRMHSRLATGTAMTNRLQLGSVSTTDHSVLIRLMIIGGIPYPLFYFLRDKKPYIRAYFPCFSWFSQETRIQSDSCPFSN